MNEDTMSVECRALLARVSQAYTDADQDRYRLERSIAISSEEMSELAANLAAERDRLRALFNSAAVGMSNALHDGTIIDCNDAYARMIGRTREEVTGRRWVDFVHPEEREAAWVAATEGFLAGPRSYERRYLHSDGSTVFANVTVSTVRNAAGEPTSIVAIIQDITERRQLEVSLQHAQKLEAIGRLAAGVAHEINTPLQFVGDNLTFLDSSLSAILELYSEARNLVPPARIAEIEKLESRADLAYLESELSRAVSDSMKGAALVGRIVRAMKSLAHQNRSNAPAPVDVNALLENVAMLAKSETRHVAEVRLELGPIPPVMAYADDLAQVFLNLLVNAAHAVGEQREQRGLGKIRIRSSHGDGHVVVCVEDDGPGIPADVQPHVFEPFFTTKEVGRGTGQGLALARALIVDKHQGELWFDSTAGHGTTFYVRLSEAA
jgi:PAS domain S-box-containing protein